MTRNALKTQTRDKLAAMARRRGVPGWQAMRKGELVDALARLTASPKASAPKRPAPVSKPARTAVSSRSSAAKTDSKRSGKARGLARARPSNGNSASQVLPLRQFGPATAPPEPTQGRRAAPKDRFVVMVRDSYWLHAFWDLSSVTVRRAEAALGAEWHRAVPTIRVLAATGNDFVNNSDAGIQDIPVHGGVNHWYIPLDGSPRSYRLQIGYKTPAGRFFALARSNIVTPPRPGTAGSDDGHWTDIERHYERVFSLSGGYADPTADSPLRALFEERLRRTLGSSAGLSGSGDPASTEPTLHLEVHADLVVYGATSPGARLTLQGDPIMLRKDGGFVIRVKLEEGRQVIPAVAVSADGSEQCTVILALERNTKKMELQSFDDA